MEVREKFEKNENLDILEDKISFIKSKFPHCFNKEGALDFKKLQSELSEEIDIENEGYSLNWLGKSYANVLVNLETETVLSPDLNHNNLDGNKESHNFYIKGDNLDVLKHLVNAYTDSIDIIYIDPPYNTGSDDFIYQDNFNFTPEKLHELASVSIEEAKRILDFTERKSNSHSAWLTFMYPRLFIARELLKDDGIIMISIDDNEHAQLKLLCDNEVFGENNFIGTVTWEKRTKAQNTEDARDMFQSKTEYILLYKKNQQKIRFNLEVKYTKDYPEKDEKGPFRYYRVEQMSALGMRGRETMIYPILGVYPDEGKQWKLGKDTIDGYQKRDDLLLLDGKPCCKIRPEDEDAKGYFPYWSHFFDKDSYGTAETGKSELTEILNTNKHDFETVKPLALIKKLLFHKKTSNDEIILDFFSGSGTTAHAVMLLNAEDKISNVENGGKRKYIMVQLPEPTKEGSNAREYGYKDITDIGIDRIKKAAQKIKNDTNADIDYGFKIFEIKNITEKVLQNDLSRMLNFTGSTVSDDTILNQFGKETVLTTWMLEDGHPLTVNYEEVDLGDGYIGFKAEDTLYLLDGDFTVETNLKVLIEKVEKEAKVFKVSKIVLFGYSFATQTIASLQDNMKHLRNGRSSADIHVEVRY